MRLVAVSLTILVLATAYTFYLVNDREKDKLLTTSRVTATNINERLAGNTERGKYVAVMAGCVACHTDTDSGGKPLAGGVRIDTPFGNFYSPNITSDPVAGIGAWSTDDFVKAMSIGKSPTGDHYYPAFPYTSYSAMTTQDMLDLKAWLDTVEPVATPAPTHDVAWPFSQRLSLVPWKALYFDQLRKIDTQNRGNYLVNGPAHCAECHSSRNLLGGLSKLTLVGNKRGPEGNSVPGISTADLSDWTVEDLELFLEVGITPSGDFTGGHMADVIEFNTGLLTADDRTAIANYLLSEENHP